MGVASDVDVRPKAGKGDDTSFAAPVVTRWLLSLKADSSVDIELVRLRGAALDRLREHVWLAQIEGLGDFVLAGPNDQPTEWMEAVDAFEELPDYLSIGLHIPSRTGYKTSSSPGSATSLTR